MRSSSFGPNTQWQPALVHKRKLTRSPWIHIRWRFRVLHTLYLLWSIAYAQWPPSAESRHASKRTISVSARELLESEEAFLSRALATIFGGDSAERGLNVKSTS
eukprot:2567546-Rhodomonas_salina.2